MDLQRLARSTVRLFGIFQIVNGLVLVSYSSLYAKAWVYFGIRAYSTLLICCHIIQVLLFIGAGLVAMRWADAIVARVLPGGTDRVADAAPRPRPDSLEEYALLLVRLIGICLLIGLIDEFAYLPEYVLPLAERTVTASAKIGVFWWLVRLLLYGVTGAVFYLRAGRIATVLGLRNDETMPR